METTTDIAPASPKPTVLLLGRRPEVLAELRSRADASHVVLVTGTALSDVRAAFARGSVDTVIIGAGLGLDDRLRIVEFILERSSETAVHLKDWVSGPAGMQQFVAGVLDRLTNRGRVPGLPANPFLRNPPRVQG